jgi:hypothetical protein
VTAPRLSAGIASDAGHAGNRAAAAADERAENAASSRERRMECGLRLASANAWWEFRRQRQRRKEMFCKEAVTSQRSAISQSLS